MLPRPGDIEVAQSYIDGSGSPSDPSFPVATKVRACMSSTGVKADSEKFPVGPLVNCECMEVVG